jgi:peptidyl-dipeptidase Dcp
MDNPLLAPTRLPPLDKVQPAHFLPAIDAALERMTEKVQEIKAAPPGFATTVVPLAGLFEDVSRIGAILNTFVSNAYTPELSALQEQADARIDAAGKTVFQDPELGARFDAVWQAKKDALNLDADDKAILRHLHDDFEDNGAFLPPEGQQGLRALDERLITLARQFGDNLLAAADQQAVLVTDAGELKGLSPDEIESFAANAREKGHAAGWRVTPERLLVDELLERAESPAFRKKIFDALGRMGTEEPYDNRPVVREMMEKRHEVAQLLGYPSFAAYTRKDGLVPGLDGTLKLMNALAEKALPKFESDMRELEKFAGTKLEPWDVPYYAAKQRQALYGFDANDFAKYLELEHVLSGMFSEAGHLHGIDFKEARGHAAVHPDVRVFEVTDHATGAEVGLLHVDVFARAGTKSGGAWMELLQPAGGNGPPVVSFNMNVIKPPPGRPALVGLAQAETAYHELGHCIHGLLGTHVKYPSLQGTEGAGPDYIEIFSMINEPRAFLKENLRAHARHVETGLPPDDALIDRLTGSKNHFLAAQHLRGIQNGLRDLAFHSAGPGGDEQAVDASAMLKSPYALHLRPYGFARFDHLFSSGRGGYAAAYVDYTIAQVHAADGYAPFLKDPYDPEQAKKLTAFYRRGSGGDPAETYRAYRGRDALPDAMLEELGVAAGAGRKSAARGFRI